MMRYGINKVFTLSYDSESSKFSLTLCIGQGEIKFKTFDVNEFKNDKTLTQMELNRLLEEILSEVEFINTL